VASSDTWSDVPHNLTRVRAAIDDAVKRAGRAPGSARLLAVSKTKPVEAIEAALAAGQRDFGENYVQELATKAEAIGARDGLVWHAIGQLQRNKVKAVLRHARVLHAVDRVELVREIGKRARELDVDVQVLIEVNVAGEAQKGGCAPRDLATVLAAVKSEERVRATGLMTVPPADDDPESARPFFRALAALRDEHGGASVLPELSMGMSHDFAVAIEEGSTIVRVGTAIFGARAPRTE
jgi:hypothetical protein